MRQAMNASTGGKRGEARRPSEAPGGCPASGLLAPINANPNQRIEKATAGFIPDKGSINASSGRNSR